MSQKGGWSERSSATATTASSGKLEEPHTEKEKNGQIYVLQSSENCPYIDIHIGTHQFRTLLDTGAQVSLVSEEFLKLCDPQFVKPSKNAATINLRSATGHSLEASEVVKIRVTIGKVRMYHDFLVVKDFKHDMILGVDFLNNRKAILDFDS